MWWKEKDYSPSEEERNFLSVYGSFYLESYYQLSEYNQREYKRLELLYNEFFNLWRDYYEDLRLYAYMYRNVPLHCIEYDVASISFFVAHKKEIIGYKKRLSIVNLKDRIAVLYGQNPVLFPKLCLKYAGVDFQSGKTIYLRSRNKQYNFEHKTFKDAIRAWQNEDLSHVLSINDLTRTQCELIMRYGNTISNDIYKEYADLVDKYLGVSPYYVPKNFHSQYELATSLLGVPSSRFNETERQHFLQYLSNKMKRCDINSYFQSLKEQYNSLVAANRSKRNVLNEKAISLRTEIPMTWNYEGTRKKEIESEVGKIEKTIEVLDIEYRSISKDFINSLLEDPQNSIFITLYEHPEETNRLINESLEIEYNRMWLNSAKKMQDIERNSTCYLGNYKRWGRIFRGETSSPLSIFCKSSIGDPTFQFNKPSLMCDWISVYRQEIEQKKKELEEQERKEAERRKAEEEKRRREEEARRERYRYNERNKHQRDAYIHFDAKNHIYTVGGMALQSVTNFVEGCFPKFEAEIHAKGVATRMGISVNEVIAMWEKKGKESRDLGTLMHQKIEKFYLGISSVEDDSFRLFKQFANQISLQPYRTEWTVYDTEYNIAGTIDFVDYQNGKFTIYDWKRSNKIISNGMPIKSSKYKTMGLSPLEHLDDCPYYHYALQLSLYKFILERNYNLKINDLRLGIFHPDYNKPYVLRMPYLEDEIKTLMDLRADVIL